MSGIKYLLDTNFVLGLLKATPEVVAVGNDDLDTLMSGVNDENLHDGVSFGSPVGKEDL